MLAASSWRASLTAVNFSVRFAIKQGTLATSPVAPSVTQNTLANGVWEIPVGTVRVASMSTANADAGLPSVLAEDVTGLATAGTACSRVRQRVVSFVRHCRCSSCPSSGSSQARWGRVSPSRSGGTGCSHGVAGT